MWICVAPQLQPRSGKRMQPTAQQASEKVAIACAIVEERRFSAA